MKTKSLYDICVEKKITNTDDFFRLVRGKKFKTITAHTRSGHNLSPKFTIPNNFNNGWGNNQTFNVGGPTSVMLLAPEPGRGNCYLTEVAFDSFTKVELEQELERLEKECQDVKERLSIINELGLEEYDDKIIKVVQLMGNFEIKKNSKLNKLEQAKLFVEALES